MSRRTHRKKQLKPKWKLPEPSWRKALDLPSVWGGSPFYPIPPSHITWTYGIEPRSPYQESRRMARENMSLEEKIVDDYREGQANALEEAVKEILTDLKNLKQRVQQMESQLRANSTAQSQAVSPNESENNSGDSYV